MHAVTVADSNVITLRYLRATHTVIGIKTNSSSAVVPSHRLLDNHSQSTRYQEDSDRVLDKNRCWTIALGRNPLR